jgi:1,4-dihydroxy-2-naphthoate octaprenyltransferase
MTGRSACMHPGSNQINKIIKMGRFRFLAAGFILFSLGGLYAVSRGASFSFERFTLGYAICACAHLSIHYSNDYFDRVADRFATPSPISGGSGILPRYPELAEPAKTIAVGLICGSLILGLLYVSLFSPPGWFILFVIAGNAIGWFYSAPPLRFSYRRMGELSTVFAIGFLIPGMGYYVVNHEFFADFLLISIPLAFYGFLFIASVELPDVEADRVAGKWTMVARRGREFGWNIAFAASFLAFLSFCILALMDKESSYFLSFSILSLIPLIAAFLGLRCRCSSRDRIIRYATGNIGALVLFFILTDFYLILSISG